MKNVLPVMNIILILGSRGRRVHHIFWEGGSVSSEFTKYVPVQSTQGRTFYGGGHELRGTLTLLLLLNQFLYVELQNSMKVRQVN